MEKIFQLLNTYQNMVDNHLTQVSSILGDPEIIKITEKWNKNAEDRKVDIGFNLFSIISDAYHYENFHSRILEVILDPDGKHNERDKYLELFLRFIKKSGEKSGINIELSDYKNATVFREIGRIDLLIEGPLN